MLTYQKTLIASAFAVLALLVNAACAPLTGADASGDGGGARKPAAGGTALAAVDALAVKGRAPRTGYEREKFGRAWADVDRNGCGTRDDILQRDLSGVRLTDGRCKVASGTLKDDPYTGGSISYVRGRSKVDIDHVVALSDAWQKGAQKWDPGTRLRFANDPLNLLAVDSATNRRKSDGDAATWLPPNKAYRCTYVARQIAVKKKYGVWVTSGERDAMKRVLAACPEQRLP
ncbi:HNH endonuclease family protein [Streptomyces sp. NPDC054835]|uniref:HNH endonuclease family protein n=1 Tax=unclassified Streptomyces TaxID=2593676 RepID=UPI002E33EA6F|nr:HNH endonuclease family protein [Streptomyces sp. NBC_01268]